VDIDPKTYNIDATLIEAAMTPKTKAIMPVSLYGQCADYDAINTIAAEHKVAVIEDAAQSFGARYKDKKSCALTTIACTSFFPSKPLGGYGDSGACFTDDDDLAAKMRQIRMHGEEGRYQHVRLGMNARMDSIQAAVLLAKLDIFPEEVEMREGIGRNYTEMLQAHVQTPFIEAHNRSVYAQYTIQVEQREQLQAHLNQHGIPNAVHYPLSMHQQAVCAQYGLDKQHFPHAEAAAKTVISLPMHPYLSVEQQKTIVEGVVNFLNQ